MRNENNDNKKLSKKDLVIVVLSAVLFILLIAILVMARRRDKMITTGLEQNSEISSDEIQNSGSFSMDKLVISEINADKWLELHNSGSESIDISELRIMVSGKTLATIPEKTVLKKDGYYIVELSTNPGESEQNVMTIIDSKNEAVKSILVPQLRNGASFGVADAEANIWGYLEASKGKANSATNVRYLVDNGIGMSAPGGFYSSSFELELECSEGEKIFYTTDGSAPTTESEVYENKIYITNRSGSHFTYATMASYNDFNFTYTPLSLDCGTVVRAIKVDSSGNILGEMNQTYYVGLIKDNDYLNLPVISITTDPENLFGYEDGIYIAGKAREDALIKGLEANYYGNYYNPWKKPAKIAYFEPTKDKTFEVDAQINIASDNYSAKSQKGLVISFSEDSYSGFSGSSIVDFISSEGIMTLTQNYDDDRMKIRNFFAKDLADDYGIEVQNCKPCVVFLEGEYWGLYTIRSNLDEEYFKKNYSLGGEEVLVRAPGAYSVEYNSFYNFATQNDLSLSTNYEQVKDMLDIDAFIDYVCFNVYLGNSSFSPSRGTAWRTVNTTGTGLADGKWRYVTGDLSDILFLSEKETPTINTYLQPGIQGDLLFQSLLMNAEFCNQFETRMKKMINEVFKYEECTSVLDSLVSYLKKPALASNTRFAGNYTETMYTSDIEMISSFLESRPEIMTAYTENFVKNGGDLELAREMLRQQEENNISEENVNAPEDGNSDTSENADEITDETEETEETQEQQEEEKING